MNERQNNSQIPDLSFFTISDVFFCGGGLESDDSFLLWQTTQGFNAEKKTPNEIISFQNNPPRHFKAGDYMRLVMRTHLIQTSPSSRPVRDASGEEEGGGGEEEVEEEERWGQEALF